MAAAGASQRGIVMQNTLKSLLLLVAALSAAAMMGLATAKSQFCAGFEHGFVTGYKQAKRTSSTHSFPFAPFSRLKSSEIRSRITSMDTRSVTRKG